MGDMCYGFLPVVGPTGAVDWIPRADFVRLFREGKIKPHGDGFHYAQDDIGVYVWTSKGLRAVPMRWDLVPRHFLKHEDPALSEMLKRKGSRAKGSRGFSSYNARAESLAELFAFRDPWREGLRCATPASAFLERPNMEGAPEGSKGKEYEIRLDGTYYLAGIWDAWENSKGERLESCAVITVDSGGNAVLRGIWHERCPLILDESLVQEWLDPKTTPERAMEMMRLLSADHMDAVVVPPRPKALRRPAEGDQQSLF